MSIAWTIVLTVLIAGERLLPQRSRAVAAVAAVLVVVGGGMAAGVGGVISVPALTRPSTAPPRRHADGHGHARHILR